MSLDAINALMLDGNTKGMPGGVAPFRLDSIAAKGWNLLREDLTLPAAVLKDSAIRHNSAWMRDFIRRSGASIAPHGKTTMAPQLFAQQIEDGAWAITLATPQQIAVARSFGHRRIVLANQLVGRQAIRAVLAELQADPGFEFLCLVDSLDGVELLRRELEAMPLGRPFEVLLEGGVMGGRTGCRSIEEALAVARRIAAVPELALAGIEGFEDVVGGAVAEAEPRIAAFLEHLVDLARACAGEELFAPGPVILSAGGSKYFDQVSTAFRAADLGRPVEVVLRSGCYLSHDSKIYTDAFARLRTRTPEVQRLGEGLRPALELWALVQSMPEPGLAIATMGKRDVSHDVDLPLPLQWFRPGLHQRPQDLGPGFQVIGLYDQHACMRAPADSPLRVGDLVSFGISHPCTTFDKWRLLHVVDDDYTVTEAIRTFF
jgi:D-serine dehydratase